MKKSSLKNGMVVELRKGTRFMFINDCLYNETHEYNLSHFDEDLKHIQGVEILDVVKVYRVDISNISDMFKFIKLRDMLKDENLKLIWKRTDEVDWGKVEFGTKVKAWDETCYGERECEVVGKFLACDEKYSDCDDQLFLVCYEDETGVKAEWFQYCKLIKED